MPFSPRGKKRGYESTYNLLSDENEDDPDLVKSYSQTVELPSGRTSRWLKTSQTQRYEPSSLSSALIQHDDLLDDWNPSLEDASSQFPDDDDSDDDESNDTLEPTPREHVVIEHTSNRRGSSFADAPLRTWAGDNRQTGYRQEYLDEEVRAEGCGRAADTSCNCERGHPRVYRCETCSGRHMTCRECLLSAHSKLPLHHVSEWNGSFFQRVSLSLLGLRVQVGHEDGSRCVLPYPGHPDFVVIHANGLHHIHLDYCGCDRKVSYRLQLLRFGWYPSTVDIVRTVSTEEALAQFSALTCKTKVSAYGYYEALECLTDPLGLNVPNRRYKAFLRTIRQHDHVKLMKEAGRGNVVSGIETTKPGELAVQCPACPHPGINLPPGWEEADESQKFLYCLFLAMDANFRLKNRNRGESSTDVELHNGLAYFVKTGPYMEYIRSSEAQRDISTCSGFRSLSSAETKFSHGLLATGVAMVICARHEFIRALGVGDLQAGERYPNMDYIFFSTMSMVLLLLVVISYDIVCQWKVNLFKRMDSLPPELQLSILMLSDILLFGIPKFHAPGHNEKCATQYSLNLMWGAGRTDGEGIERRWGDLGRASTMTKEMSPGARHDTLDILFTLHNLSKYCMLGLTLRARLLVAVDNRGFQRKALAAFSASISSEDRQVWIDMAVAWEKNKEKPNPYLYTHKGITETEVRARLAQKEKDIKILPHDMPPSIVVKQALSIEDKQRRLRDDLSRLRDLTADERAQIDVRRAGISREISKLRDVQKVYMPGLDVVINNKGGTGDLEHEPEKALLFLPSALDDQERKICTHSFAETETELRIAQGHASLDRLRTLLQTRYHFTSHRNINTRGQRPTTRVQTLIREYSRKIEAVRLKYTEGLDALKLLDPQGRWQDSLKPLTLGDLRALQEPLIDIATTKQKAKDLQQGLGEGYRTVSWIWTGRTNAGDHDDREDLRVEWLKSRARTKRWEEEVDLLKEEMRRVRAFLEYKARWWESRAVLDSTGARSDASRPGGEEAGGVAMAVCTDSPAPTWSFLQHQALASGVQAHALRQAHQQRLLRMHFTDLWEKKWSVEEAVPSMGLEGHPDFDSDAEDDGGGKEAMDVDGEDDGEDDASDGEPNAEGPEDTANRIHPFWHGESGMCHNITCNHTASGARTARVRLLAVILLDQLASERERVDDALVVSLMDGCPEPFGKFTVVVLRERERGRSRGSGGSGSGGSGGPSGLSLILSNVVAGIAVAIVGLLLLSLHLRLRLLCPTLLRSSLGVGLCHVLLRLGESFAVRGASRADRALESIADVPELAFDVHFERSAGLDTISKN
ncbi:hypothetical protein CONPUDRAFT_76203 [Coniophora puteana RWD-64-598 SS2]|uniref:CxC2-like cysteine cluster KDZ transposase-associated domain-containing protein n=1 Tax=Coniophora puteana (strain RWD-64-598) TaxID=741705 RepID=A0A5M3MBF4_CONPW|nr:uncharacterized protein CONPUDRAFT_76203 [Coniophora puteana RWD-64-598 SS2]EIW76562.1 hypothetical protein CONPUDRAFT_76203 [Coniophora puteana RWD-64-598 SS2]